MLNIYLAGKVDESGAWRDAILGTRFDYETQRNLPLWELRRGLGHERDYNWPWQENTYVLGMHNYVGPYRVTSPVDDNQDVGYFHGSVGPGLHGQPDEDFQTEIVNECMAALNKSDIVFAVLNRPDCFGTLVELGVARALGKYVSVVTTPAADWEYTDYWFAGGVANRHSQISEPDYVESGFMRFSEPGVETIRDQFRDTLVAWTSHTSRPRAVTVLKPGDAVVSDLTKSFAQIARWTSDPRVRNEAKGMLKRLGA